MIYEKPNRKWVLDKLSSIDLIGDIAQFMMRFVIVNHQLCVLRRAFHTNISEQTHGERKQRKRNHWDDLTITEPSSRAFKLKLKCSPWPHEVPSQNIVHGKFNFAQDQTYVCGKHNCSLWWREMCDDSYTGKNTENGRQCFIEMRRKLNMVCLFLVADKKQGNNNRCWKIPDKYVLNVSPYAW